MTIHRMKSVYARAEHELGTFMTYGNYFQRVIEFHNFTSKDVLHSKFVTYQWNYKWITSYSWDLNIYKALLSTYV